MPLPSDLGCIFGEEGTLAFCEVVFELALEVFSVGEVKDAPAMLHVLEEIA